jgi:two-component system, NtrC family, response regulator HydG
VARSRPGPAPPRARVLVVDDAPDTLELIERNLLSQGYEVTTAGDARQALAVLGATPVDLLVTDVRMPGLSGMDLIREVRERHPGIEIVVITGYATVEGAVEALRTGAWDYLAKPFTDEELFQAVARALARRAAAPEPAGAEAHGLIGRSRAMRALHAALAAAAQQDGPVLLHGEPGSGRESAARVVHALAGRDGPFVRLSLGARPAPAGAPERLADAVQRAAGGTLYLADLDAAPGGMAAEVAGRLAPARRGAASGRAALVASSSVGPAGLERLFARCGALPRFAAVVAIPPLRERGDDVLELARYFLAEASRALGVAARAIGPAAAQALRVYAWPGNVRELRAAIMPLALAARDGPVVVGELPPGPAGAAVAEPGPPGTLAAAEREHIERALRAAGGNKSRAAAMLGIDRKTLRDKLRPAPPEDAGREPGGG